MDGNVGQGGIVGQGGNVDQGGIVGQGGNVGQGRNVGIWCIEESLVLKYYGIWNELFWNL